MGSFHRRTCQQWLEPIRAVVSRGLVPPSFVPDVLHTDTRYSGDDAEAVYLATSVIAASGETIRMTINIFIVAMITHPETQERACEEIDRVCTSGRSHRLPRMADLLEIPYVEPL